MSVKVLISDSSGKPPLPLATTLSENYTPALSLSACPELLAYTGEAYEALVAFLDESAASWRVKLKAEMTKAVRKDGKVR